MSFGPSSRQKIEVVCRYGTACNRKGCFFKHTKAAAKSTESLDSTADICFAFLAGNCSFGSKCYNKHPSLDDCGTIVSKLGAKPCRFGSGCYTEGCLYYHGEEAVDSQTECTTIKTPSAPTVVASGPVFKSDSIHEVPTISNLPSVLIPDSVWRTYPESIGSEAFAIENPIERFAFVNSRAKPAPSIVDNEGCFVVDLHFQSTRTVQTVLDQIIPQCLKYLSSDFGTTGNNIWLITGAGSSVPKGHQSRGGVLYEYVIGAIVDLATRHDWLDVAEGHITGGMKGAIRIRRKR